MQSPLYPDVTLLPFNLEPDLPVYECPKSGGIWIPLTNYLEWKRHQPRPAQAPEGGGLPAVADDTNRKALVCPESGRLLFRYKVGHGLMFHVDVSPDTGGLWLDRGEWQALKSKGLHTELNLISSSAYQHQIRASEYEAKLDQTFRDRIGAADFAKVAEFKKWLADHPRRRDICNYLSIHLEPEK